MPDKYRRAVTLQDIREGKETMARAALGFVRAANQMSSALDGLASAIAAADRKRRSLHRTGTSDQVNVRLPPETDEQQESPN